MRGPIDFLIIGFEKPKFDGRILDQLKTALDNKIIALVALTVIYKDPQGNIAEADVSQSGDQDLVNFVETYSQDQPLVDDYDITEVSELLESDSAACLLVIEHLWAKPLKQAITKAGGILIAEGRIHPEAQQQLSLMEG